MLERIDEKRGFEQLAVESRRARAIARQRPCRLRECSARNHAVSLCEALERAGHSCSRVARRLSLHPRTLNHWKHQHSCRRLRAVPLGRPCHEAPVEARLEALRTIDEQGAHLGIPTLKSLMPHVRLCQLVDLQCRYRHWRREVTWEPLAELTWQQPGAVWAIDHSESPADIDGSSHTAILAIRDLAGGYQIAWLPVIDQTATETVSVLRSIFDLYGAPLVIKSDNGSAFKSELFANLLEAWDCQHLRSPARTLRYNGSCEAEIGAMKVRTRHYAERRGAAHEWTCDDLNAARRQANHIHRSETDPYRAAAERWSERETIIPAQRTTLANLIQEHGNVLMTRSTEKNNCTRSRAIERQALSQALVSMGLLSVSWRRIHPPLNPSRLANIS